MPAAGGLFVAASYACTHADVHDQFTCTGLTTLVHTIIAVRRHTRTALPLCWAFTTRDILGYGTSPAFAISLPSAGCMQRTPNWAHAHMGHLSGPVTPVHTLACLASFRLPGHELLAAVGLSSWFARALRRLSLRAHWTLVHADAHAQCTGLNTLLDVHYAPTPLVCTGLLNALDLDVGFFSPQRTRCCASHALYTRSARLLLGVYAHTAHDSTQFSHFISFHTRPTLSLRLLYHLTYRFAHALPPPRFAYHCGPDACAHRTRTYTHCYALAVPHGCRTGRTAHLACSTCYTHPRFERTSLPRLVNYERCDAHWCCLPFGTRLATQRTLDTSHLPTPHTDKFYAHTHQQSFYGHLHLRPHHTLPESPHSAYILTPRGSAF